MGQVGATLADAATMGPRYAERLLGGITPERFARFSRPGGDTVTANHPAFIIGHLSLYPQKVAALLGGDTASVAPPEIYEKLFSKDAKCQDDVDGNLYPTREHLVQFFDRSYSAAIDMLRQSTDGQLAMPNPVESPIQHVLPTLGSLVGFYMTGHVMIHLGQLSTWRRMEQMPPA
jgi:hypothetical protein